MRNAIQIYFTILLYILIKLDAIIKLYFRNHSNSNVYIQVIDNYFMKSGNMMLEGNNIKNIFCKKDGCLSAHSCKYTD